MLERLFSHRPGREERELIAEAEEAQAAHDNTPSPEDAERAGAARNDHVSWLANVWVPRHPVRAAIESRLQDRADRKALETDRHNQKMLGELVAEYRARNVTKEQVKEAIQTLTGVVMSGTIRNVRGAGHICITVITDR
jgi:hypothetical protein